MTALSVWLDGVATTTILSTTARELRASSTGLTVASPTTKVAKSTGWDNITSRGTTGAWAAGASEPDPAGQGWVLEDATLDGQTMANGTWTATIKLTSSSSFTARVRVRIYKFTNSGSSYTQVAELSTSGDGTQSIATTGTTLSLSSANTNGSTTAMDFASGDFLYAMIAMNITVASGSNTATVAPAEGTTSLTIVTPGYSAPTPISASDSGVVDDSGASIGVSSSDSGTGSDSVALAVPSVDSGSVDDSGATVAGSPAAGDSAIGGDGIALAVFAADSGTFVEGVYAIGLTASDAGSGTDTAGTPSTGSATVTVELWENGSLVASLGTYSVTSSSGQVLSATFDASLLSDPTGAGVEVRVYSTAARAVDIGAIEWNAQTLTPINPSTPKSASDTGVGSQSTVLTAASSGADSGSSSNGPYAVAASISESAVATESATISATLSTIDSGAVAEGGYVVALTSTDSATGSESAQLVADVTTSDIASVTEVGLPGPVASDFSSITESASTSASLAGSDAGTVVDASPPDIALFASDGAGYGVGGYGAGGYGAGSSIETGTIAASDADSDAGVGADGGSSTALAAIDAGIVSEAATFVAALAISDDTAGASSTILVAAVSVFDSGSAVDGTTSASLQGSDSSTATDAATSSASIVIEDAAVSNDSTLVAPDTIPIVAADACSSSATSTLAVDLFASDVGVLAEAGRLHVDIVKLQLVKIKTDVLKPKFHFTVYRPIKVESFKGV